MEKIKVIFFDIGGVYIKSSGRSAVTAVSNILNKDFDEVRNVFVEIWDDFAIGRMSEEDYYKNLTLRLGIDAKTMAEIWTSEEMFSRNIEVELIITELKKKGYTVATITDVDPVHLKIHMEKGTYKIFEYVIDSVNAKSTKSSGKDIYEKALKVANLKPDECIMIDDTPKKLIAARELGINTILFEDAEKLKEDLNAFGVEI